MSESCIILLQKQIWEISASSWLYYKNLLRCTVTWTSKQVWVPADTLARDIPKRNQTLHRRGRPARCLIAAHPTLHFKLTSENLKFLCLFFPSVPIVTFSIWIQRYFCCPHVSRNFPHVATISFQAREIVLFFLFQLLANPSTPKTRWCRTGAVAD